MLILAATFAVLGMLDIAAANLEPKPIREHYRKRAPFPVLLAVFFLILGLWTEWSAA
jgi:uncharacterized membrane protein YiaA